MRGKPIQRRFDSKVVVYRVYTRRYLSISGEPLKPGTAKTLPYIKLALDIVRYSGHNFFPRRDFNLN